ncbi:MAG: preprotein translocase subunit YajC [Planctomycetota bacterium]|nr:preprotein translocase subunit YajC [Planctomycetota bacterium]
MPTEQPDIPAGGGLFQLLPMFFIMFMIMYFMIIRPQRKKEKNRLEMLSQIRKNDHILTTGGIYGVVMNVKDDELLLRIDDTNNVRVRLSRSSVVGVIDPKDKEEKSKD